MNKKKGNGSVQYKPERESYFYMDREPEKCYRLFRLLNTHTLKIQWHVKENLEVMIDSQIMAEPLWVVSVKGM